jgi:uncharacterized protein YhhL (DUF1145 family)
LLIKDTKASLSILLFGVIRLPKLKPNSEQKLRIYLFGPKKIVSIISNNKKESPILCGGF